MALMGELECHSPSLYVLHGYGVGHSAAGGDTGARRAPSSPREDLGTF